MLFNVPAFFGLSILGIFLTYLHFFLIDSLYIINSETCRNHKGPCLSKELYKARVNIWLWISCLGYSVFIILVSCRRLH